MTQPAWVSRYRHKKLRDMGFIGLEFSKSYALPMLASYLVGPRSRAVRESLSHVNVTSALGGARDVIGKVPDFLPKKKNVRRNKQQYYTMPYANKKCKGRKLNHCQKSEVKGMINGSKELKHIVTQLANVDADSVPVVTKLTMPSQGLTDDDRIGDKILVKSIQLDIALDMTSVASFCRFVLIRWLPDDNVEVPTNAKIWENTTLGSELSQYNINNRNKFQVLWDRRLLNHTGAAVKKNVLEKHRKINPTLQLNVAAVIRKGEYYLVVMGNQRNETDHHGAYIRVNYCDM